MIPLGNLISFQDYNGSVLAAGKLYVYNLGRNGLATVYGDVNGAVVLPNPLTLDNLGMCDIWLSPVFDYTIIITDAYGQEMFSRDIYPQRPGSGETIGTQLYNGIQPIVVNNQTYTISANTSRLGVVTPLYFVKDDEEETIIGFSGEAIIPSGTMNESAIGYEDGKITSYNGSAFSAGLNYSAGDNIVINGATIALDSAINLLDAQGAKAVSIDATEQQFTNLTSNNGSILDASGLYVSDLNMENAANLSKDGLYVTGTGSRISMSNDMSDIYGDNHFEIYGYQKSGDGISAMHLGGNDLIVEHGENGTITASYSLTGACSSAQSALNIINSSDLTQYSAGANIDITDHVISGKDWTDEINDASANAYNQSTAWTDSQGYLTGVDLSEYAKTDFVVSSIDAATSGKYDTSSFSAISGSFLTAHQSLPQSADWNGATTVVNNNSAIWNNTTNVVSSNSASWGASNPQIPVTGINGIKISESGDKVVFEVSGDYATNDDLTSKQDNLTYGYHDTAISSIDSSALYDSSAHARINTLAGRISDLSSNKLDESAFSDVSGNFATTGDINDLVTSIAETYQPKLSFDYNEDSAISAINGSALAGGGLTGDYVSGVNTVNVRPEEWNTGHRYEYITIISGDVQVRTAEWFNDLQVNSGLYSLSAIGNELGNKLDSYYVNDSTTIKNVNSHAEMGNSAYRPNGFDIISADYVELDPTNAFVRFETPAFGANDWLYSAIIIAETNTTGAIYDRGWNVQSFEDGSATIVKTYNPFSKVQSDVLSLSYGWSITNIDASAMTYSSMELAPLAFKDDIIGITYTTGSI